MSAAYRLDHRRDKGRPALRAASTGNGLLNGGSGQAEHGGTRRTPEEGALFRVAHRAQTEGQVSTVRVPSWDDVTELQLERSGPCVSLYLPVHRRGRETEQDPLRFRNLLDAADDELLSAGERGGVVAEILKPARELLGERPFWSRQEDGLAVFLAPGWSRMLRLPFDVPELAITGSRFHLRPLVFGLQPDQEYYVLALSRRGVRLLRGGRFLLEEVELREAPSGVEEVLSLVEPEERQFQARTGARMGDRSTLIFHGHGLVRDTDDERILEYFREVDESVLQILHDKRLPLVLAGISYLLPLYRAATGYGRILEQAAEGNPDDLSVEELHARTWALVQPAAVSRLDAERDRYDLKAAKGQAVHGLERVLTAAFRSRVETVFVADDAVRWGRVGDDLAKPRLHDERRPGDEDLLDRVVVETLRAGGDAFTLARDAMPARTEAAAILRY
jgi:hypothetical protein